MKYSTPSGKVNLFYRDTLLRVPHLLIAGATGSGKSTIVNGLIRTALFRFFDDRPDGAQLVLIDPKRVELSIYRNLPHTLKYASEPAEMLAALDYAMQLCENRYKLMQSQNVRKYSGSDVYVIIDEFADLVCIKGMKNNVHTIIQRLAQIGRAAKVHIILCTQCPLVSVIPTQIKVNFDARIGLRTATAQHSRNILDISGCENLPRFGKAIYSDPDGVQMLDCIPYYTDEDLQAVVQHWTAQVDAERAVQAAPSAQAQAPARPQSFISRAYNAACEWVLYKSPLLPVVCFVLPAMLLTLFL